MKILTIGGATQDIFLNNEGTDIMTITKKSSVLSYMLFKVGEKIEIDSLTNCVGGGAANSAVSFKHLGFDVSCFCNLGTDQASKQIISTLNKEGVNTSLISKTQEHATATSFIVNALSGEQTILAYRGANSYLELDKLPFEEIKSCNQLYITSLSNNSAQLLPHIVSFAKQHKIPVAINPGTSQLSKGTLTLKQSLQHIDILIMNSTEARTFMIALVETDENYKKAFETSGPPTPCGLNLEDETPYLIKSALLYENFYFSMRKFFTETLKMGPKIVVVTNGCNGVYVATNNTAYFHPSMKINVTNTVGAGDAFGSCFVSSLLLGYNIPEALRNGIINGASVLTHKGAQNGLLTHDKLKAKIKNVSPNLVQTFSIKK